MKQADAAMAWFTPVLAQRFVSQYYAAGKTMPLIIPCTVLFPKSLKEIGEKSIGIIGTGSYTSLIETPMNKTYVANFMKKYNSVPTTEGISADVALTLYVEAVKATGGDNVFGKDHRSSEKSQG